MNRFICRKKELTFEENMDNGIDFNRNILHDKTESFTYCTQQRQMILLIMFIQRLSFVSLEMDMITGIHHLQTS